MTLPATASADLERRFSGLRRLWGDEAYTRVRAARVGVVGIGGVGSWAVEALARSGVGSIVMFDFDQVAESNINRQVHALGATVGAAKVEAMRARVADIHPGCDVIAVEEFVTPENWPALLPTKVDVLIDACDQVRAKAALAVWSHDVGTPLVMVGAAGGKSLPQAVEVADIAQVTHDPVLARVRQHLRKARRVAAEAQGPEVALARAGRRRPDGELGVCCVFSREPVVRPAGQCEVDGNLNCHGYGSSVAVTAGFGLVAAAQALAILRSAPALRGKA